MGADLERKRDGAGKYGRIFDAQIQGFQQCIVQWDNPAAPLVDVSSFGRQQNTYTEDSSELAAAKETNTYSQDTSANILFKLLNPFTSCLLFSILPFIYDLNKKCQ